MVTRTADTVVEETRRLGEGVRHAGRNAWLFGMGAYAWAREETRDFYQRVMQKGEQFEHEDNVVMRMVDRAGSRVRDIGRKVEDVVEGSVGATLSRAGVPNRDEIRTLIQRVEQLSKKVDTLAKK